MRIGQAVDQAFQGEMKRIDARLRNPAAAGLLRTNEYVGSYSLGRTRLEIDERSEPDSLNEFDITASRTFAATQFLDRSLDGEQLNAQVGCDAADKLSELKSTSVRISECPALYRERHNVSSSGTESKGRCDEKHLKGKLSRSNGPRSTFVETPAQTRVDVRRSQDALCNISKSGTIDMAGLD